MEVSLSKILNPKIAPDVQLAPCVAASAITQDPAMDWCINNIHSGSLNDIFWMFNNYVLTVSFNDVHITSKTRCLSNV